MQLTLGDALEFKKLTTTEKRPEGLSILRGDLVREIMTEEEWIALFFVMLRADDPSLTIEAVGEMMDFERFQACTGTLEELYRRFVVKGSGEPSADPTE